MKQVSRRSFLKMSSLGVLGGVVAGMSFPMFSKKNNVSAFTTNAPTRIFAPENWGSRVVTKEKNERDRSGYVREIQYRIAAFISTTPEKIRLDVNGSYGNYTVRAVENFQKAFGLPVNGERFGPEEAKILNSLEKDDGSTKSYNFSDFYSNDGMGFKGGNEPDPEVVKENIRQLMWRIEMMNKKLGKTLKIKSGFRSIAHNQKVGGTSNSYTTYGIACELTHDQLSMAKIAECAKSSGFSGVRIYEARPDKPTPFVYVDYRLDCYPEHPKFKEGWMWA